MLNNSVIDLKKFINDIILPKLILKHPEYYFFVEEFDFIDSNNSIILKLTFRLNDKPYIHEVVILDIYIYETHCRLGHNYLHSYIDLDCLLCDINDYCLSYFD